METLPSTEPLLLLFCGIEDSPDDLFLLTLASFSESLLTMALFRVFVLLFSTVVVVEEDDDEIEEIVDRGTGEEVGGDSDATLCKDALDDTRSDSLTDDAVSLDDRYKFSFSFSLSILGIDGHFGGEELGAQPPFAGNFNESSASSSSQASRVDPSKS